MEEVDLSELDLQQDLQMCIKSLTLFEQGLQLNHHRHHHHHHHHHHSPGVC